MNRWYIYFNSWNTELANSYCGRVLEGVFDLRLPEEDVAPTGPPEHALKGRHALPQNDTRNKTAAKRVISGKEWREGGNGRQLFATMDNQNQIKTSHRNVHEL